MWSYSGKLLVCSLLYMHTETPAHMTPEQMLKNRRRGSAPFTPEESKEYLDVLRSLASECGVLFSLDLVLISFIGSDSNIQTAVQTRIVARILLRVGTYLMTRSHLHILMFALQRNGDSNSFAQKNLFPVMLRLAGKPIAAFSTLSGRIPLQTSYSDGFALEFLSSSRIAMVNCGSTKKAA